MTLKEIIRLVAKKQEVPVPLAEGFIMCAVEEIIREVNRGGEVKIRGLGTLRWRLAGAFPRRGMLKTDLPPGWKLGFVPARKFRARRAAMSDEGFVKYGVELDNEKVKQASENTDKKNCCPRCQRTLDDAGACPVHGTEPFESTG
jgi:nucleoid DNA-binding protein